MLSSGTATWKVRVPVSSTAWCFSGRRERTAIKILRFRSAYSLSTMRLVRTWDTFVLSIFAFLERFESLYSLELYVPMRLAFENLMPIRWCFENSKRRIRLTNRSRRTRLTQSSSYITLRCPSLKRSTSALGSLLHLQQSLSIFSLTISLAWIPIGLLSAM